MDAPRIGRLIRALRQMQGLRQEDLARLAGCSQSAIARLEAGEILGSSLELLDRTIRALDARMEIRLLWRGADADRLLDAEHASIVETLVRRLARAGWSVEPETTFNVYGERGSIDVFARHPGIAAPLVIEVKTAIGDVQATIAAHDRKARLAPRLGAGRASDRGPAHRLLVVAGTRTARRHIEAHAATFRAAYPERDPHVQRWLARPEERLRPLAGLVFVTPTRQAGGIGRHRVRTGARGADPRTIRGTRVADLPVRAV